MILTVPTISGEQKHEVFDIYNFPYEALITMPVVRTKNKNYYNVSSAFDIETTTIIPKSDVENPYGFMYHWQMCLNKYVVFGRTWKEFTYFLDKLRYILRLNNNNILVVFVHNLAFEFQFMYDFIQIDSIFAKDVRKPLKVLSNGIEFRCSYFLSNMSLAKFCENSELCTHYKLDGEDFDYNKIRTPKTKMTETEKAYCFNDVYGLCECIDSYLLHDTIASLPLTSTGFVRRECRKAMAKNKYNWYNFKDTALTEQQYLACKKAFRGGNTHANRYYTNTILENVHSVDLISSYPAWIDLDTYPVGKFTDVTLDSMEKFNKYIHNYCVIMELEIFNIELKDNIAIPYLDIAHCFKHKEIVNDNGRVISAEYVRLFCTEIDYKIIEKQYNIENFCVNYACYSKRGKLPKELREKMMEFYDGKTQLKGIANKVYEYLKSKNKLNAFFGMMVTAIDNADILFTPNEEKIWTKQSGELDKMLEKFYSSRNNFLSYQWGVYVTANARFHLQEMLDIVGMDCIYTDTDSIKFIGEQHIAEFEQKNKEIINKCENNDIRAYSIKDGKKYYLGVWDYEGKYDKFKTLGAKKYCTVKDGKLEITVSGMHKKLGAKAVGSIENFVIGKTYKNVGRTVAYYNDVGVHTITVNGENIITGANIGFVETTYTLGVSKEYGELLEDIRKNLKIQKDKINFNFLEKTIDY